MSGTIAVELTRDEVHGLIQSVYDITGPASNSDAQMNAIKKLEAAMIDFDARPADNSPPAFPNFSHDNAGRLWTHGGMTLRDWFAGQALAGTFADATQNDADLSDIVRNCYQAADAMIKARAS